MQCTLYVEEIIQNVIRQAHKSVFTMHFYDFFFIFYFFMFNKGNVFKLLNLIEIASEVSLPIFILFFPQLLAKLK